MSRKITALDWFIEQIEEKGSSWENARIKRVQISIDVTEYFELKIQAEEIERQQIIDAHLCGQNSSEEVDGQTEIEYYEQTYRETTNDS